MTRRARLIREAVEAAWTLAEMVPWEPAEKWTDEQRAAAAGSYHDWQSGR